MTQSGRSVAWTITEVRLPPQPEARQVNLGDLFGTRSAGCSRTEDRSLLYDETFGCHIVQSLLVRRSGAHFLTLWFPDDQRSFVFGPNQSARIFFILSPASSSVICPFSSCCLTSVNRMVSGLSGSSGGAGGPLPKTQGAKNGAMPHPASPTSPPIDRTNVRRVFTTILPLPARKSVPAADCSAVRGSP